MALWADSVCFTAPGRAGTEVCLCTEDGCNLDRSKARAAVGVLGEARPANCGGEQCPLADLSRLKPGLQLNSGCYPGPTGPACLTTDLLYKPAAVHQLETAAGLAGLTDLQPAGAVLPRLLAPASLCSPAALLTTPAGLHYAFQGGQYWRLDGEARGPPALPVAPGFPRPVARDWPGLPAVDAAVTWRERGITYFFRGGQYWKFREQQPEPGYPKDISFGWSGLESNIDAAFQWGRNNHIYFFKGSKFWKFDTKEGKMAEGYPRAISSAWTSVPSNIEAALVLGGKTYFFKSGQYWKLDDRSVSVVDGYPRQTAQNWFGGACSDNITTSGQGPERQTAN